MEARRSIEPEVVSHLPQVVMSRRARGLLHLEHEVPHARILVVKCEAD